MSWENNTRRIYCSSPRPTQKQPPKSPSLVPGARRPRAGLFDVCVMVPRWAAKPRCELRAVATNDRIFKYSQAVVSVYLFLLCKQPITLGYYSLA